MITFASNHQNILNYIQTLLTSVTDKRLVEYICNRIMIIYISWKLFLHPKDFFIYAVYHIILYSIKKKMLWLKAVVLETIVWCKFNGFQRRYIVNCMWNKPSFNINWPKVFSF